MVDVDYFKKFNDNYGHIIGDYVLQKIGNILNIKSRKADIVCRYGGEEFLLAMPGMSLKELLDRAEILRKIVENQKFIFNDKLLNNVTISLGVSVYPDHSRELQDLINIADEALYRAKAAGRNCVMTPMTV